jgi:hypothetical protein
MASDGRDNGDIGDLGDIGDGDIRSFTALLRIGGLVLIFLGFGGGLFFKKVFVVIVMFFRVGFPFFSDDLTLVADGGLIC